MVRSLAFILFFVSASAAHAQWELRLPGANDDRGSAFVVNAKGHRLDIGCGNGGTIFISLTPDTRPAELNFIDDGAVLFFRIDGREPLQMPATCGSSGCFQDFMLGGQPWPINQMRAITSDLRSGSNVDVLLGGKVMSRFELSGSSAALDALKSRTQCDGL